MHDLLTTVDHEWHRDLIARLVLEPLEVESIQSKLDECLEAIERRVLEGELKRMKEQMHHAERRRQVMGIARRRVQPYLPL